MELIPILSTIILIATISTFLLAIGAYILYKIRERKYQHSITSMPSSYQAEVLTPAETQIPVVQPVPQKSYSEPLISKSPEGFRKVQQPAPAAFTPTPKEYAPTTVKSEKVSQKKLTDESKFMKYTSEGYISPQEDKSSGAVKWK